MGVKSSSLDSNISIITLLTFLSYATYITFKFGESIYYGYPTSLIWIDLNSLLLMILQNSIIIVAIVLLLRSAFKSTNSFLKNIVIITIGMMTPMLILGDIYLEWEKTVISLILFVIIFLLNSCLKKAIKEKNSSYYSKWNLRTLLLYFLLVLYIGNYSPSLLGSLFTDDGKMIVSTNGSEAVLLSCDKEGNKVIQVKSILDEKISKKANDILTRNWFYSECKFYNSINQLYI